MPRLRRPGSRRGAKRAKDERNATYSRGFAFHHLPSSMSDAATPSPPPPETGTEPLDVLIVGAGLSGIGAAHHLQQRCPGKRFAIVEKRASIGGTWDLFRYPGVRSDSDMYTLGYRFRPWTDAQAIADGPSILRYIRATAEEAGIVAEDPLRPRRAARRLVERRRALDGARRARRRRRAGDVAGALSPRLQRLLPLRRRLSTRVRGRGRFRRHAGQPAVLARRPRRRRQAHRRHRQRRDRGDARPRARRERRARDDAAALAELRRRAAAPRRRSRSGCAASCPSASPTRRRAGRTSSSRPTSIGSRGAAPSMFKQRIVAMAAEQLGPGCDAGIHFTPRYKPWDQRLCLVPDGDLFAAIRAGRASVVTDTIDRFIARRHPPRLGRDARRRHRRRRHRAQAQPARRHRAQRRRPRPPRQRGDGLQGNDAERRAQPRALLRLRQRVVDAEGRPHRRVRVPAAAPHGPARRDHRRAAPRSVGRRRSPSSASPRATSSARARCCPSRARGGRGRCTRTTSWTCSRCASAASTTACCASARPGRCPEAARPRRRRHRRGRRHRPRHRRSRWRAAAAISPSPTSTLPASPRAPPRPRRSAFARAATSSTSPIAPRSRRCRRPCTRRTAASTCSSTTPASPSAAPSSR